MNRSTDRTLTTHVGSLARPKALLDDMRAKALGDRYDAERYEREVREAVERCVRLQADVGFDSVSDGEQGKIGHGHYVVERLTGFETLPDKPTSFSVLFREEEKAFPEFYEEYFRAAMRGGAVAPLAPPTCTSEISYCGHEALERDLANLRAAVDALGDEWSGEAFMPAVSPSGVGDNEYYPSEEEYLFAVADALQVEYEAIVEAGFLLQIDDPWLSMIYGDSQVPLERRRKRAELYVEAINHAARNISEEKIRFHTCYGINHGPRVYEIPLMEVVDLVLRVNARALSFEAANPRHEHEYHIWETVRLPEGRILLPGVITHASSIVEHPELVAERILRFTDRVGRENVIASADCGFASQAQYKPEVHPKVVEAKFRALQEGARLATERLW